MTTLIWFRDDLRTTDHSALQAAVESDSSALHAVFLLTPSTWQEHGWGPPRVAYVLKTLQSLSGELRACGITLHVLQAKSYTDAPEQITRLARELDAKDVHAGIEYGLNEQHRDQQVEKNLAEYGISLTLHNTQTILPVEQIKTGSGTPYRVFTPFRKAWEQRWEHSAKQSDPIKTLSKQTSQPAPPSTTIPTSVPGFDHWDGIDLWPAGTQEGEVRLERFLDHCIAEYSTQRDRPDHEGTSSISPWLATGALSPGMCLDALTRRYGHSLAEWPAGARCWQGELVWREFYRHVMGSFPVVSKSLPMQKWTRAIPWRDAPEDLTSWQQGSTGIEIVDAAMHQLNQTGWMHNRARMIVAMFLTKNLLIDWRHGERYFSQHLVDYDFASNNGGWQWAASTGTDAAPYFRIFNPDTQAQRFDPDGEYRRRWLPDDGSLLRTPIVELKSSRKHAIEVFKACRESQGL